MVQASEHLARAREHFVGQRWEWACAAFAAADVVEPLQVADLERYAEAAQISGRIDEAIALLVRVVEDRAAARDVHAMCRAAYWLWSAHGFARAEFAQGAAWVSRARTLAEESRSDAYGWVLVPQAHADIGSGAFDTAAELLHRATAQGTEAGDVDLVTIATLMRGRALMMSGSTQAGLSLLDHAIVSLLTGATSPRTTAVMFCAAIGTCHQAHELQRAREWSVALDQWLSTIDELDGAYFGNCRIYRAMLLRLRGEWQRALEELEATCRELAHDGRLIEGHAWYELAETRRLRGDPGVLEAFQKALALGYSIQPGMGRYHLARGETPAALTGLRRALAERDVPMRRFELLLTLASAAIEAEDREEATDAIAEMATFESEHPSVAVKAATCEARGVKALADNQPAEALTCLRRAAGAWRELAAPYETARVSVLIADACEAVGDEEGAEMERSAARETFVRLGAGPDVDRLDARPSGADSAGHGLSDRELEVLRLVVAGKTNAAIAAELFISERTVHRHVSNTLAKLDAPSRTAAAIYAVRHDLV